MKTTLTVLTLALSLFATASFAKTEIKDSKIIVKSKVKESAALAIGKNSTATVGGVDIRNSKIKKSKIIVKSNVSKSAALAIGKGSSAGVGSVNVR